MAHHPLMEEYQHSVIPRNHLHASLFVQAEIEQLQCKNHWPILYASGFPDILEGILGCCGKYKGALALLVAAILPGLRSGELSKLRSHANNTE